MAVASSAAYHIAVFRSGFSVQNHPIQLHYSFSDASNGRRRYLKLQNSGDDSATTVESESNLPEEVPKISRPSLISVFNVEKALRRIAITDVDHYGRLDLPRGCTINEVEIAYRKKATEAMNSGLAEEDLNKELDLLKESFIILSTAEERRLYDWSLARNGNADRYVWPFEVDSTPTSFGDPPPQEPEDEGPTRIVGYILLEMSFGDGDLIRQLQTKQDGVDRTEGIREHANLKEVDMPSYNLNFLNSEILKLDCQD